MSYMTFEEQIKSHLYFLQSEGIHAEELDTSGELIRCHPIGGTDEGRGEYVYKSNINPLDTGVGVVTWSRGTGGKENIHKTYGLPQTEGSFRGGVIPVLPTKTPQKAPVDEKQAEEKARLYFEVYSKPTGTSRYLTEKKIKAYGIRFRESDQYGASIVVPARDINGKLKTCQTINEDGSKRWLSGRSVIGAFHTLVSLYGATNIGICEGFATSSTCAEALESLGVPVVCAFDASNLMAVGAAIHSKHPTAKILLLADNDRHLVAKGIENKGLEAAKAASNALSPISTWLAPDFANLEPVKELSDWNDLARELGIDKVREQIAAFLKGTGFSGCPQR